MLYYSIIGNLVKSIKMPLIKPKDVYINPIIMFIEVKTVLTNPVKRAIFCLSWYHFFVRAIILNN